MDKAMLLTLLLASGSLLTGSATGAVINTLTGSGLATAYVAFVEKAVKSTEAAPGTSLVPNIPEQVEAVSTAVEQMATGRQSPPSKPTPHYLMMGIFAVNLRALALIPAIHSVLPIAMLIEGGGRLRIIGKRLEDAVAASALAPLVFHGFVIGGSAAEYPVIAPLLVTELLPLATLSYIASKAFLLRARGLKRLGEAYRGSAGIVTAALILLAMSSSYEAHILSLGG